MKIVNIVKAEPIGDQVIEDTQIVIKTRRFEGVQKMSREDHREWQHGEARAIFDALYNSLPGGVFDQLLGIMMTERASQLIVSHKR